MKTKKCNQCGITKPRSEFYKDNRTKQDGLYGHCKTCHNKTSYAWQLKNKKTEWERKKLWSRDNPEKVQAKLRRYRSNPKNKKKTNEWNATYKRENKAKINAINAARRALKFKATPPWTTKEMKRDIEFLFTIREEMINPKEWHVDHYYPLDGDTAKGLHVPWNLRLIPAKQNISKRNTLPVVI